MWLGFFSVTVHTSGWKSLLSFLFLLISRPFFATPGTLLFLWLLLIISFCVYLLLSSIASLTFVSLLPYPSSFFFFIFILIFSCYFFIDFPWSLPFEEERFLFFSLFPIWISHSHVARWLPMIDELYVCRLWNRPGRAATVHELVGMERGNCNTNGSL